MFNIALWRNLNATVISFLGLLLTFVYDMFNGNMAVSQMSQLSLLTCGTKAGLRPVV